MRWVFSQCYLFTFGKIIIECVRLKAYIGLSSQDNLLNDFMSKWIWEFASSQLNEVSKRSTIWLCVESKFEMYCICIESSVCIA